jgi:hypothetical protein
MPDLPTRRPPTGCPAWVAVDALEIQGTGNGIEHNIFRNPGDGTQTETFTGTVTITAFTADSAGNPVAPDLSVPPYTGHLTEWFGATFKNMNPIVDHATVNFSGTAADGSAFSIHASDSHQRADGLGRTAELLRHRTVLTRPAARHHRNTDW